MTAQFNDEDGRAIDVLLDRPTALDGAAEHNGHDGGGNGHAHQGTQVQAMHGVFSADFQARVRSVERVLNLLGVMPAGEPPVDLVERTLQRVQNAGLRPVVAAEMPAARPEA